MSRTSAWTPPRAYSSTASRYPSWTAGTSPRCSPFPDGVIDLSLRYRNARSAAEEMQQKSIFMIDNWCASYDQKVRDMGGIGFFLGGIGPDGHIAFNVRGSDPHSTTRLTHTNYETQAAAASDLGGIEMRSPASSP